MGAYGFTALKIADLLCEAGISFSIAGRNREEMARLKDHYSIIKDSFVVDISDEDATRMLISKADVIINCIGPYNLYGGNVLKFCVEEGKCCIDISGEQNYVRRSFEQYGELAMETGACIIHSLAFESALADLIASSRLNRKDNWEEISSIYYFEKSTPSPGTRLTMQVSKFFPCFCVQDSILKEAGIGSFKRNVENVRQPEMDVIVFMPYPEVYFFYKQYRPKHAATYLLSGKIDASIIMAGTDIKQTLESVLEREARRKKRVPDKEECSRHYFELILYALNAGGEEIAIRISGHNMYMITASLVFTFLYRMLNEDYFPVGIHTPSEVFPEPEKVIELISNTNSLVIDWNVDFKIQKEDPGYTF